MTERKSTVTRPIESWTPIEFADRYRVSRATIYVWLKKGWLQSAKIGGSRRILKEHDAAFIARFNQG